MASWESVEKVIESTLKSAINYAETLVVHSITDYIEGGAGKLDAALQQKKYVILIAPPEEGAEENEPMLSGYFRKKFNYEIAVISKSFPLSKTRLS
jgi:hypothetical protein